MILVLAACTNSESGEVYGELPTHVFHAEYFDGNAAGMIYKDGYVFMQAENTLLKYTVGGELLETKPLDTVIDSANVVGIALFSDGSYVTDERFYDFDNGIYKGGIAKFSADGELLAWTEDYADMNVFGLYVTSDDILYVLGNTTFVLNADLELIDEIKIGRIDDLHITGGERIMIEAVDMTVEKATFRYIDTKTHELSKALKIPDYGIENGYDKIFYGETDEYDYYLKNKTGLYGCTEGETPTAELIINWTNSNLASSVREMVIFSREEMLGYNYNEFIEKFETFHLTKVPDDEVTPKKIINLAVINSNIDTLVIEFNKSNPDYRIIVNDYGKYNANQQDDTGVNLLNADIAAGKIPDMFIVDGSMPVKGYLNNGLFADMYDYIDGGRLLDCIREPAETDGKLYQLIYSFYIETLTGKTDVVGDKAGWTIGELIETFDKSGAEYLMDSSDPLNVVSQLTKLMYDDFIDEESGTCNFDCDEFRDLIAFTHRVTDGKRNKWFGISADDLLRFINGDILLANYRINTVKNYYTNKIWYFSDSEVTLKGYPSADKYNGIVVPDYSIAVSSKTKNSDGIKQVLEFLLRDEYAAYDRTHFFGTIPPTLSALKRVAADEAQHVYYVTNDFSAGYDTNIDRDEAIRKAIESGTVPLVITDEMIDEYIAYIQSVGYVRKFSTYESYDMFHEELEIYFRGEKSLDDTIDVIQKRIALFMAE